MLIPPGAETGQVIVWTGAQYDWQDIRDPLVGHGPRTLAFHNACTWRLTWTGNTGALKMVATPPAGDAPPEMVVGDVFRLKDDATGRVFVIAPTENFGRQLPDPSVSLGTGRATLTARTVTYNASRMLAYAVAIQGNEVGSSPSDFNADDDASVEWLELGIRGFGG